MKYDCDNSFSWKFLYKVCIMQKSFMPSLHILYVWYLSIHSPVNYVENFVPFFSQQFHQLQALHTVLHLSSFNFNHFPFQLMFLFWSSIFFLLLSLFLSICLWFDLFFVQFVCPSLAISVLFCDTRIDNIYSTVSMLFSLEIAREGEIFISIEWKQVEQPAGFNLHTFPKILSF